MNAAIGIVLLETAWKQLQAYPIIDVLVKEFNQQFSESIAANHHENSREFYMLAFETSGRHSEESYWELYCFAKRARESTEPIHKQ